MHSVRVRIHVKTQAQTRTLAHIHARNTKHFNVCCCAESAQVLSTTIELLENEYRWIEIASIWVILCVFVC